MARLEKKLFFHYELELLTGLRIGDSKDDVEIGGVDNPVIRRKDTYEPYIPGSSLKGKIRCLLEQRYGENANSKSQNTGSAICKLFGAGENTQEIAKLKKSQPEQSTLNYQSRISRIIVRDAYLTRDWFVKLRDSEHTDMPFTEIKWENTIDRILGKAKDGGIRQMERIPAGAKFNAHFVINIFSGEDEQKYRRLLEEGIELLTDDYLGGSGTRGYGQVKLTLTASIEKKYEMPSSQQPNAVSAPDLPS